MVFDNYLPTTPFVNVRDFGAVGDGNATLHNGTDDTAAIQAAIDASHDNGLGPIWLPPLYFIVTQLEVYPDTVIMGANSASPTNKGSVFLQKDESNLDVIIPKTTIASDEFMHWTKFKDFQVRGGPNSTAGSGIKFDRRLGEHSIFENIQFVDMPENGLHITRGATPGSIFRCGAFRCGTKAGAGYGFNLEREVSDVWHHMWMDMISGDNNEDGLIHIDTGGAGMEMMTINNVKSETSILGKQQDCIVVDGFNGGGLAINNVSVDSASQTTNSIVKVASGSARIRGNMWRVRGATPKWIDDLVDLPRLSTASTSVLYEVNWDAIGGAGSTYKIGPRVDTITEGDTTPSVQSSITLKTAGTSTDTITDFDNGYIGQAFILEINHANKTLGFSSANLLGNGGVDKVTAVGERYWCVMGSDSKWYVNQIGA